MKKQFLLLFLVYLASANLILTDQTGKQQIEVATLSDDKVVYAWIETSPTQNHVNFLIYSKDLKQELKPKTTITNVDGGIYHLNIIATEDEKFALTFEERANQIRSRMFVFDSNGDVQVSNAVINNVSTLSISTTYIQSSKRIFMVWLQSLGNSQYDIRYRVLDLNGGIVKDSTSIKTLIDPYNYFPSAAALLNGDIVVTWPEFTPSGNLFKRTIDGTTFLPVGNQNQGYATGNNQNPKIAALTNGNYVITWESYDSSPKAVYISMFDSSHQTTLTPTKVNLLTHTDRTTPAIIPHKQNGFAVVFEAIVQGTSNTDIYVRQFDQAGQSNIQEAIVNNNPGYQLRRPVGASFSNDVLVLGWLQQQTFEIFGDIVKQCQQNSDCYNDGYLPFCGNDFKCRKCTGGDSCSQIVDGTTCISSVGKCGECSTNAECSDGKHCFESFCVECSSHSQCTNPILPICSANSCSACTSNAECQEKDNSTPVCNINSKCISGHTFTEAGCYIIEAITNNADKIYLSNIENGVVSIGVNISVWSASKEIVDDKLYFAFESQSTDRILSIKSAQSPVIETLEMNTPSTLDQWRVYGSDTYCIQNVESGKFLNLVIGNPGEYSLSLTDTCDSQFNMIDVAQNSIQITEPTAYHLKYPGQNSSLEAVNDYQVDYSGDAGLWSINPVVGECSFTLTNFNNGNSFIVSHFDSEDFAAINDKMNKWYVLRGDGNDRIGLLNQKWGFFVTPGSREINYPETKTTLVEESNQFLQTEPIISNLPQGHYLITSNANGSPLNLMSSIPDIVHGSAGFGLWYIHDHEGITFDFESVSTGEYLEVLNDNLETTNALHHWHIIDRNDSYCIQDVESRKYITINDEGVVGLVDTCENGEFTFTRYSITSQVPGEKLIRYYITNEATEYVNFGLYDLHASQHQHTQLKRNLDQEYLEIENDGSIEVGKTQDRWLFVQEYNEDQDGNAIISSKNCIVEMHSGQFLEFTSHTIGSTFSCVGRFELSAYNVATPQAGYYTLQELTLNKYLHVDYDAMVLRDEMSIWKLYQADDFTYTLQSFTSLKGLYMDVSNSNSLEAQTGEDRWFILTGSEVNQYCFYNIHARVFMYIKGHTISSTVNCEEALINSLNIDSVTVGSNFIYSTIGSRYLLDTQADQVDNAIAIWDVQESEQKNSYTLRSLATGAYLGIDNGQAIETLNSQRFAFVKDSSDKLCFFHIDSNQYLSLSSVSGVSLSSTCSSGEFELTQVNVERYADNSHFVIHHPITLKNLLHTKSHDKNIEISTHTGIWKFRTSTNILAIQSLSSQAFIQLTPSGAIQGFSQDQWFVVTGQSANTICFLNAQRRTYLSISSNQLVASNTCDTDSEFTLTPIEVGPSFDGFKTVKSAKDNTYLFQNSDIAISADSKLSFWEFSTKGTIESQFGDRGYLNIEDNGTIQTSTRLDHWISIVQDQDLNQYCLYNLENAQYFEIQGNGIITRSNCIYDNAVLIESITYADISDGTFKLEKVGASATYLNNNTNSDLTVDQAGTAWAIDKFYDNTYSIKS